MKVNTSKQIVIKGFEEAVPTERITGLEVYVHNSLGYVNHLEVFFNKFGEPVGKDLKVTLTFQKEKSTKEISCFSANIQFETPGFRTYVFKIIINNKIFWIKCNSQGEPEITEYDLPFFETFVYKKDFSTPEWAKGGIMYQIYVDTFNSVNALPKLQNKISKWGGEPKWLPDPDGEYRNDKFFGGNLEGIIQKIPYLKTLGVTILYLTPIFESVSSNRYDIVNYEKIDEMIGNWQILEELYKKAHEAGMYLVLDCVFNHCNPNNLLYSTQKHLFTGNFWWGYKHLVEFDMNNIEFQNLVRKWLNLYLLYSDGIRLDVADNLSSYMLQLIREEIKLIEQKTGRTKYILGEVWKHAIKGDQRSFLYGNELDAPMNYQFTDAILRYTRWGNYQEFKEKIFDNILKLYPKCSIDVLMNPLSTHDIPRVRNSLTNPIMLNQTYLEGEGNVFIWDYDKLPIWRDNGVYQTQTKRIWEHTKSMLTPKQEIIADKLQKLSVVLQYTLPGIPSIFAGDELGVTGLKDPFNRVCMPWEEVANNEMKEFYIRIGKIRTEDRELFGLGRCELIFLNERCCVFRRFMEDKSIYVICNITNDTIIFQEKIQGNIIFSIYNSQDSYLEPYNAIIVKK